MTAVHETQALLTELLLQNHKSNALLLADNATHNHIPHILITASNLSCTSSHLQDTYKTLAADLSPWSSASFAPIESDDDLSQRLGGKQHQRAFLEYFERRLREFDGDWERLLKCYVLGEEGARPMLGGLVGGFAHPLILLADAIEARDANVAVEALALTACDWNPLHAVVEAESRGQGGKEKRSPLQILQDIRSDHRFSGVMTKPGVANTMVVLKDSTHRGVMLEYLDALDLAGTNPEDVDALIRELVDAAVLLLCTVNVHSGPPEAFEKHKFDFYLTHQLTFCRCLQILITFFPSSITPKLLRAGRLMMALTYVTQLRPNMKPELLSSTPLPDEGSSKTWTGLTAVAIGDTKEKGMDPHFVKVIRTLKEFATQWPEQETTFLKACVRFEAEFDGWTGFGASDGEALDV